MCGKERDKKLTKGLCNIVIPYSSDWKIHNGCVGKYVLVEELGKVDKNQNRHNMEILK